MTLNIDQQPVPSSDPLMKAWIAYQATEGYQNTAKRTPSYPHLGLLAAFTAGWRARADEATQQTPETQRMPIDIEAIRLENIQWNATPQLRWFRPPSGTYTDIVLQQLWERVTGERQWRTVETCLAD